MWNQHVFELVRDADLGIVFIILEPLRSSDVRQVALSRRLELPEFFLTNYRLFVINYSWMRHGKRFASIVHRMIDLNHLSLFGD